MNQLTPANRNDYSVYTPAAQGNTPHAIPQDSQPIQYIPRPTAPCGNTQNWSSPSANYTAPMQSTANNNTPESLSNPYFWPAYLKTFVGYWARLDFLIGNQTQQVIGKLLDVGASYIVLEALEPDTLIMCDLYSLKFATIIYGNDLRRIANSMR